MPLFPAFIDLSRRKVLVIGGGRVAARKIKSLLKFTKNIKVVAPRVSEELRSLMKREGIEYRRRKFIISDLKGVDLVVVAVDDLELQKRVFELCERKRILCNSVDSPEHCNFIFPSLIVRGDLTIGISTGGRVPALSKRIRELLEVCLPDNLDKILEIVSEERERLSKGEERRRRISELVNRLLPLE